MYSDRLLRNLKLNCFNITIISNGVRGTSTVIYPCETSFRAEQLQSTITEIVNVRLPTHSIIFVCVAGLEKKIKSEFLRLAQDKERKLRKVDHIVVLPYGIDGRLLTEDVQFLQGEYWDITDEYLYEVAEKCIETALEKANFKLRPPHGYRFQKPSGVETDIFIRTGNVLSVPSLLFVFCQLMLRRIPDSTRTIFIDSFTILSFALRIQSLFGYFARLNNEANSTAPSIQVFRSYEVESVFSFPNENNYFIIISASTTNSLAKKLIREHSANASRIVHMIGMGDDESELEQSSVYFLERKIKVDSRKSSKIIGISTDEFMTSHGNPNRVRISTKHVCQKVAKELKDPYYSSSLRLMTSGANSGYGHFSLFSLIKCEAQIWSKGFIQWLKCEVIHEIPSTTRTIVYLDDPLSKKFGEEIQGRLNEIHGKNLMKLISAKTLKNKMSDVPTDSTVVLVAFEDPHLEELRKISVQLRERPDVYQHYVIGYDFSESQEQFDRLRDDLKFSSSSLPNFHFSNFLCLPVSATNLHESIFDDYGIRQKQLIDFESDIPPSVMQRLKDGIQAEETSGGSEIFFRSIKGDKLALRGGSIFFSADNNSGSTNSNGATLDISQEVVYLAVALALQQAREERSSMVEALKFDRNPFVISVIDPKMFWRFNDGILQAALLRALSKSELDYSTDETLSAEFHQIAISVFENSHNNAGEATLEFLAAIASEKVSLREQEFEHIKAYVLNNDLLAPFWECFARKPPF